VDYQKTFLTTSDDRGERPVAWPNSKGKKITVASLSGKPTDFVVPDTTLHHIIPYANVLAPFWNLLVSLMDPADMENESQNRNLDVIRKEAKLCMLAYLETIGMTGPDKAVTTIITTRHSHGKDADVDESVMEPFSRELHTKVTWSAWNIIEGPSTTIRRDDPGEFFDDFEPALQQLHLTNESLAVNRVRNLYAAMVGLIFNSGLKQEAGIKDGDMTPNSNMVENLRKFELKKGSTSVVDPLLLYPEYLMPTRVEFKDVWKTLKHVTAGGNVDLRNPLRYYDVNMWKLATKPQGNKIWVLVSSSM
jgi:hypothetical protein